MWVTCGHSFDTHSATWCGADNTMDFWEDISKLQPHIVTKQFEMWACSQDQNLMQYKSLGNMQRDCMQLINSSFRQLVGTKTQLNFSNFKSIIKLKHDINKKGWPEGVPFTSPYNVGNIELIRTLWDTLKKGDCYFYKMTPREHQEFEKELEVCHNAGEVTSAPHKKQAS
ncbi:hypothetical protein BDN67DRAFT_916317 [Paxillus ammoniavirescens]|nr:hypothetical protein BDN67DRAFT_916317 [Paxillus ammoniavirescens]